MANTVLITELYRSYLAEFLLSKGYEVHGTRSASTFNTARIDHIYSDSHDSPAKLFLHDGDFSDTGSQLTNSTCSTLRPKKSITFLRKAMLKSVLVLKERLEMCQVGELSASFKLSNETDCPTNSIKPRQARYLETPRLPNLKIRPFTREVLMGG